MKTPSILLIELLDARDAREVVYATKYLHQDSEKRMKEDADRRFWDAQSAFDAYFAWLNQSIAMVGNMAR